MHFSQFSAKRGIEIACRLSACLSVRDVGRSHKLEILETNCTDNQPNIFALRSPKSKTIHLLLVEHGEILGRIEVVWEKVACWNTKAAISLKRVKIGEKLWRPYRNSPTLFRTVGPTILDLLRPPLPQDWGLATPTYNCNRYYLRNG